jgi:hypothetical protein
MKPALVFLLAAFSTMANETPVSVPAPSPQPTPPPQQTPAPPQTPPLPALPQLAPRAWLGLKVAKPDASITAHLPSLPPGIGFVIRSVDAGGPADTAGLREFDILWKIGDQMLVNEGQMAALLRLAKPGDEISLGAFRGGKPLNVTAKLVEAPATVKGLPDAWVDSALLPGECGGPMRVVNVAEKLASYANDEGRAEVRREGTTYQVKITGPGDDIIYEGELSADAASDKIPASWKPRIHALRRGLDHALDSRIMPPRQPRPRVVPPP